MAAPFPQRPGFDALLAWYFVSVWGTGFIASKIGLQHAAPFTFLTLRFAFGIACLALIVLVARPRWPQTRADFGHVLVAGLLMHAVHLGGSHYTQYFGLSAGITAVLLSVQPLLTALVAARWMNEPLRPRQWAGIVLGLAGVALVVWHRIDIREATVGSLIAVGVALGGVTAGTLYQRAFCPLVDLRSAALIQFVASIAVLAPLAWAFENMEVRWSWSLAGAIVFLVIGASILAVNALHTLMRRGQAARVASLIYLTPIFPVALELAFFGIAPGAVSSAGIVITCAGVALAAWRPPSTGRQRHIRSRPTGLELPSGSRQTQLPALTWPTRWRGWMAGRSGSTRRGSGHSRQRSRRSPPQGGRERCALSPVSARSAS